MGYAAFACSRQQPGVRDAEQPARGLGVEQWGEAARLVRAGFAGAGARVGPPHESRSMRCSVGGVAGVCEPDEGDGQVAVEGVGFEESGEEGCLSECCGVVVGLVLACAPVDTLGCAGDPQRHAAAGEQGDRVQAAPCLPAWRCGEAAERRGESCV